jgi:peptidoglycan/LPS O-acetylase OafA/YrhL
MNLPTLTKRPFYPALTGIRIIAAWLIFLHHYPSFLVNTPFEPFIKEFHVGIFFTLSGFLTYQLYFEKYRRGDFNFKSYILNRLTRLYPVYLLLLVITAVWQWETIKSFLLSITLTHSFFDD